MMDLNILFVSMMVSLMLSSVNNMENNCITPDYKTGICIELQDCPEINRLANDFNTPLTLTTLNFLIKSHCGYNGLNPKVCCEAGLRENKLLESIILPESFEVS